MSPFPAHFWSKWGQKNNRGVNGVRRTIGIQAFGNRPGSHRSAREAGKAIFKGALVLLDVINALKQMPFRQNAIVEDTDNLNTIFSVQSIKNYMATLRVLSVARTYFITVLPQVRVFTQKVEALVELKDVVVSLIATPFTLRVKGNRFEVSFGLP